MWLVPPLQASPFVESFVLDPGAFDGAGGIIRLAFRNQAAFPLAGDLVAPVGIAIDLAGENLFVAYMGSAAIVRIGISVPGPTILASGGELHRPTGVAVAEDGNLYVTDLGAPDGTPKVVRIDGASGAQSVVSSGGNLVAPSGLVLDTRGDLLVTDRDAFGGGGGVIRIDPETGDQSVLSSGGSFVDPNGLAVVDGGILVVDEAAFGGTGGVIRVEGTTGAQAAFSTGGFFAAPKAIAVAALFSEIYVVDSEAQGGSGAVILVYPWGTQEIYASGENFVEPLGIAAVARITAVQPSSWSRVKTLFR